MITRRIWRKTDQGTMVASLCFCICSQDSEKSQDRHLRDSNPGSQAVEFIALRLSQAGQKLKFLVSDRRIPLSYTLRFIYLLTMPNDHTPNMAKDGSRDHGSKFMLLHLFSGFRKVPRSAPEGFEPWVSGSRVHSSTIKPSRPKTKVFGQRQTDTSLLHT